MRKTRRRRRQSGGTSPQIAAVQELISNVHATIPEIYSWKFNEDLPIDLKTMLRKTNISHADLPLLGINWGSIHSIEPANRHASNIFIFEQDELYTTDMAPTIAIPNKKYIYIKLINGPIFVCTETTNGGHRDIINYLNKCSVKMTNGITVTNPIILFCLVAGELMFSSNNSLRAWNCQSGTFQPKCGLRYDTHIEPIYKNIRELDAAKYLPSGVFELIHMSKPSHDNDATAPNSTRTE